MKEIGLRKLLSRQTNTAIGNNSLQPNESTLIKLPKSVMSV